MASYTPHSRLVRLSVVCIGLILLLSVGLAGTVVADPGDMTQVDTDSKSNEVNAVAGGDGYAYAGGHDFLSQYDVDDTGLTQIDNIDPNDDTIRGIHVADDGYVYTASQDGDVEQIDPDTMTVVDELSTGSNYFDIDVGDDGYVYVSRQNGNGADKVDPDTMSIVDSFDTPDQGYGIEYHDGYVYVGQLDSTTYYKLDASDMSQEDTYDASSSTGEAVGASGDYIYVASGSDVEQVDASDMTLEDSYTHSDSVESIDVAPDGIVYSGSFDGEVHSTDPDDMTQIDTYTAFGGSLVDDVKFGNEYLYAGGYDDKIHQIEVELEYLVSGTVTDGETGDVIEDATVEASQNDVVEDSDTTDADGEYSMTLEDGVYDFSIDHPEYAPYSQEITVSDDQTEDFELTESGEQLELETGPWMNISSEQRYEVFFTDSDNETSNVTDDTSNLTVSSDDTNVITVDESKELLESKDTNATVNITAEYEWEGSTFEDTVEVTAATKDMDNLQILPGITRFDTSTNDPNVFWILIAGLSAVMTVRLATSFAGLGTFTLVVVIGWFYGSVGTGVVTATFLVALFIGLNVATNVDITTMR